jgi:hypothetical protein
MTAPVDTRQTAILGELMRARHDLVGARSRQRQKDSTGNRAALAACLTTMDRVLDRYLVTNHHG